MSSNLSKYSNSKYKSKYLNYKNKYLLEKNEHEINIDINKFKKSNNTNENILKENISNKSIGNFTNVEISENGFGENISTKVFNTLNNFDNLTLLETKSDINIPNKSIEKFTNIEISENGFGKTISNKVFNTLNNFNNSTLLETKSNINIPNKSIDKFTNIEISENGFDENISNKIFNNITNIEIKESGLLKKQSKNTSKKLSKKLSKKPLEKNLKEMKLNNKIFSEKINWNDISKKTIKKINFTKNKITIKFDKSSLELEFTKTLDETTWFDKFIRINIMDTEPPYDPTDICNIKINKLFIKPSDNYKKFIEYEDLIGKKLKSIKWIGDSWMYPSNKQECDHNHIYKIQTTGSEYYLFILRCSSKGGIDSNLIINYKK